MFTFDQTNGGHTAIVNSLASLPNGLLSSCSYDSTIKIWDITSGQLKFTFDETNGGHTYGVNSLAMLNSGLLASGSSDETMKTWDINNTK